MQHICEGTGWPKSKFEICATGCHRSKFATSNGYNSKSKPFWPLGGKAKMCLRTIQFSIFCKQTAENVNKILENKNCIVLKCILAYPMGSQKCLVLEL